MSTAPLIGKNTYTGQNGSNGTTVAGVKNTNSNFVASPAIGVANNTTPAQAPVTGKNTYTTQNGSNGTTVAGVKVAGSMGTQGPVAGTNPPSYNPGS
jgi:hypothetical protein